MPPQISRPLMLGVGLALGFLLIRGFFIPATFGDYGHYRADALGDVASRAPVYAGRESCAECHDAILEKIGAKRRTPSCENCHGPSAAHAEDPEKAPPRNLSSDEWCLTCHALSISKPKAFPQVDSRKHKIDSGKSCAACHDPHTHRLEKAP